MPAEQNVPPQMVSRLGPFPRLRPARLEAVQTRSRRHPTRVWEKPIVAGAETLHHFFAACLRHSLPPFPSLQQNTVRLPQHRSTWVTAFVGVVLCSLLARVGAIWHGFPAGWRVPAKPLQDTTIAERGLGPQDPVIEGHLPGNVNPDHSTPLFK